jgi:predicted MFS family arabinose efflux permease
VELTLVDRPAVRTVPYRWTVRVVVQLAVLSVATYVYAVAEMVPIAAMPAIASDLHVGEALVGMLTAAYAFISIVATVPLVRWTARWPKRRVLVLTLTCLTVAQALSVLAPGLMWLAASRVLCAVTHGLMWAIIVPIGARLVPATHTGRATTAVYVGSAAALVVGNPLTHSMSQVWGWRPTVAVMAVAAGAVTLLAWAVLPAVAVSAADAAATATRKPLPYRNVRLLTVCALTLIGVTAHFVSYTFIVPIIRDIVGVGGAKESWLLVAYGIAGLVALALVARAMDRRLRAAVAGSLGILCLAFWMLSAMSMGGAGPVGTVLAVGAIVVWGASAAVLPPMMQSAAIRTSPDEAEHASALYVTAFQVGILLGSVAGGLVYQHIGAAAVLATTAVLFVVMLVGVLSTDGIQTVKPRARSCSRPSSVILSGPQGGFQTQLIRKSLTRPLPINAVRDWSSMTSVSGQAAEVSVMSIRATVPSSPSSRSRP